MNREIEFRGKHIHVLPGNEHLNGTWVYGYYIGNGYILTEEAEILVDDSTVGQYIGIDDKNDNKICEGDIVTILDSNIGDDEYFIVKHDDEGARFTLESESLVIDFDNIYGYQCEVIGNIYDNPELLEEDNPFEEDEE